MSFSSFPISVPAINYINVSEDIVEKYNYTYVSFASYPNFSANQNTGYNGFVTLSPNYSANNNNIIYGSFELSPSSPVASDKASNIVFGSLIFNGSTWQFEWWFTNTGGTVTGTLRFVIFFYAPLLIASNSPINYAPTGSPSTVNGIPQNSNFLSELFTGGTSYKNLVNFFPIISYAIKDLSESASSFNTGTVSIINYSSSYTVLTSFETQDGSAPSFNTRNLTQITIYNKTNNSFSYSFYTSAAVTIRIIFIIFYTGL